MHSLILISTVAMRNKGNLEVNHFLKQTNGSITLESAFVFPLFMLLLFTIILIGVLMLNINTHHYIQLTAVERAAFIWDRYDRDFNSGIKQSRQTYGAYEHDLMLTTLSRLLQINRNTTSTTLQINKAERHNFPTGKLREDKLLQANEYLFKGNIRFLGELHYSHKGLLPRAEIKTEVHSLPLNLDYRGYASATIIDATQHIRSVDLLIYYGRKLNNLKAEKASWIDKAQAALPSS